MKRRSIWITLVILALVLSVVLSLTVSAAPASKLLKFTVYKNLNSFQFSGTYQNYPIPKWLKETKNVEVEYVSSNNNAAQRFNTMLATGQLPDVIISNRANETGDVNRLIAAKKLVPLQNYIALSKYIRKTVGTQILGMHKNADGNTYILPNFAYPAQYPKGSGRGWVLNGKVWKELGSPKVETFDDLNKFLAAVKAKYPSYVPLEAGMWYGAPAFIYAGMKENAHPHNFETHHYYVDTKTKSLRSVAFDPVFLETCIYVNQLLRDKLLTQDMLTQTEAQIEAKLSNGKFGIFTGWDASSRLRKYVGLWKERDPQAEMVAIEPIYKKGLNPAKTTVAVYNGFTNDAVMITTSAKEPKRIFEYIDWTSSPEGQSLWFGPPGTLWEGFDAKGYVKWIGDKWSTLPTAERSTLTEFSPTYCGVNIAGWIDQNKANFNLTVAPDKRDLANEAQFGAFVRRGVIDTTEFLNIDPAANTPEGQILIRVKDLYKLAWGTLFFAKDEAEVRALVKKLQSDLSTAGVEKVDAFRTKMWLANRKMMNLGTIR